MARIARAQLVDPREVEVFHCMNRCVRHTHLCGKDHTTGRNYDHRKQWLEEGFKRLASIFAIDLIGYAIMSNHFHVILRSRPDLVKNWSDTEVARRWLMLCPPRRTPQGEAAEPTEAQLDTIRNDPERVAALRLRLSNISWWMRMASEPIARRANREDELTGRFWEGRYKCVKLCDEGALLACLAYVDLNPVRAGIATSPATSSTTSLARRAESEGNPGASDAHLSPLELDQQQLGALPSRSKSRASDKGCLRLTTREYLELVEWTGRNVIRGKSNTLPALLEPLLERLQMSPEHWGPVVQHFGKFFRRVAGAPHSLPQQGKFRRGRGDLLTPA